jgi:hypothetical protein
MAAQTDTERDPYYSGGDIVKLTGWCVYGLARRGRGRSMKQMGRGIDRVKDGARRREQDKAAKKS